MELSRMFDLVLNKLYVNLDFTWTITLDDEL